MSQAHFVIKKDGSIVQNYDIAGLKPRQEWGVMHRGREWEGLARGPWSKETCEDFVRESLQDGFRPGLFYVVQRYVTSWTTP